MLMIKYLKENKQWIFSGIGVFGIGLLITFVLYMLPRRGPGTKPSISNTQGVASPSVVAESNSPTPISSAESRRTEPIRDSQPANKQGPIVAQPDVDPKQNKDEEKFSQLLHEARKLLELGQHRPACLKYQQAVDMVPASKKRDVSFSVIGEAKASYNRDDFRTAANQYKEAFQKVSIQ